MPPTTMARWYGGHAEVPSVLAFSRMNDSSDSGFRNGPGLLVEEGLVGRAAALGQEEELVLVAGIGVDLDLRREVGPRVLLLVHRERRHLRVAQVGVGVGPVDALGERGLVVAVGEHVVAPMADHDGGAGVLAPGQDHAGGDVGVLQQLERDEAVVVRRLGVVEDRRQLFQVRRAQQVGDVVHRLGRQVGHHLPVDLQEGLAAQVDRADAVDPEGSVHGPIRAVLEQGLVVEGAHGSIVRPALMAPQRVRPVRGTATIHSSRRRSRRGHRVLDRPHMTVVLGDGPLGRRRSGTPSGSVDHLAADQPVLQERARARQLLITTASNTHPPVCSG